MRIGAVFPQTKIGSDPVAIRDYAQAVEAMGYTHILVYDHVVGASTATRPDWRGPYTSDTTFQEPFVLFGYLAGLTSRVELTTGVIILPQRQTSLVAKQTAEIDVLSGGRLRLGVGIGWNPVEFEALNEDFHNRGARIEEQVAVLRALWTEPVVTFQGRWHHIDAAGIKPLPVQQPIPVWFGGSPTEPILRRTARLYPRSGALSRSDGHRSAAAHRPGFQGFVGNLCRHLAQPGRNASGRQHHGRGPDLAPGAYRRAGPGESRAGILVASYYLLAAAEPASDCSSRFSISP